MRARTIREGSVGLLILAGIGLFAFLVLWLRGINPRQRTYHLKIVFEETSGMQVGTPVRYRGVPVGRILSIQPQANSVQVEIEITQGDLRIPKQITILTTQSGLIGETSIDITPLTTLSEANLAINPTAQDCDSTVILCDGDNLTGEAGISYEDLLVSAQKISDFLTDPALVNDFRQILANTNTVSQKVVGLSDELNLLVKDTRQEIKPLTASARGATDSVNRAAQQIERSTAQSAQNLDVTLAEINSLLVANRGNLTTTLDNIRVSSDRLRVVMDTITPVIQDGELIRNLETLSANAVAASEDLKDITHSLNTTENLVLLQQTLESARDVFQSAQKIMADVDEITGDPALRNNLRNLINGLSGLVSSTQQLETQTQLAQLLEAVSNPSVAAGVTVSLTPPPHAGQAEKVPVLIFDGQRYTVQLADQASFTATPAARESLRNRGSAKN